MIITPIVVGPVESNCYVVSCPETGDAVVIDPGDDAEAVLAEIGKRGVTVKAILATHGHFDHIGANGPVSEATGAPVMIHEADLPLLRAGGGAALFGLRFPRSPEPGALLADGDVIGVGTSNLTVISTPGHTPGHVCFLERDLGILFSGDLLFKGSVGRTDLPGGSHGRLLRSIGERILTLPDSTVVYPGHGEPTTIGDEREGNPWLEGL